MTPRGILVSGAVVHDTLVVPATDSPWGTTTFVDTIEAHPGGNGANTSLALAKVGAPVRLIATIGDDDRGQYVLGALRRASIDTTAVTINPNAPTACTIVLVNHAGDRKFFHRMGVSASAFPDPIDFTPALISGMVRYHLASLFILPRLRVHAAETLARARAAGLATSLDTNWDPQGRWLQDLRPCLPHLDIIFLNEDEARIATGAATPEAAARCLLDGGARTVVIKLGPRGCAIYTGDREILSPAFDVPVKDTTGAGDCFVGGFLSALTRGASLGEAAQYGNALGAITVQHTGGASGIPDGIDLDAWLSSAVHLEANTSRSLDTCSNTGHHEPEAS
jgi:sugar/nucleoside kinase (ribokinase family)